jgi:hypothetical protein
METKNEFRALDTLTGWQGPVRSTVRQARADADRHSADVCAAGGISETIIVMPDPECPDRCVDVAGDPVWPTHGRSCGTVRWQS